MHHQRRKDITQTMQRKDAHEEEGEEEEDAHVGQQQQQQHEQQQHEQQQLDPFGLPIGREGPGAAIEELDLEDLEPRMRSVGVASRHQQAAAVPGGVALPSYHDRHRGAYLYRESPKMGEPAAKAYSSSKPTPTPTQLVLPVVSVRPPTASSSSSSSSSSKGELEAPTLPFDTALFPLERCHYYTNKTGPELFEGIEAALQETGVSFHFAPGKFKFACEYLPAGGASSLVKFVCRAYLVPEDGRTVVEFQRRAGCCIACAKVVEAVRNTLLVREGNASAAPVPVKPFKARSLSLPECAVHSPSSTPSSPEAAAAAAALQQQQQAQQCKIMTDLGACLAGGRDDVLDDFAKVLVPLSHLSPEHLLSNLAYADLLAGLVGRASAASARLAALSCLANLAAACFGGTAGPAAHGLTGLLGRDVSVGSDEGEDVAEAAKARRQLASGPAADAWFARSLGAAVAVLAAAPGETDPHAKREAARAVMHLSNAAVGAGLLRDSAGGLAALQKLAEAPADRLLQGYAQATLRALG